MVRRINVIKNFNNTVYRISVKGVIGTFILAGVMMTVPKATIQAVTNANTPKTS
jgi:hypothetical protein